jgi:TRAP transporter TAXI family solute receptor
MGGEREMKWSEKSGIFSSPVVKITAFALMAILIAAQTVRAADRPEIFRIATASKKGTFYPIGTLIAKGLSGPKIGVECSDRKQCGVPNLIAVAQVSNGSVANVETVSNGGIEAALAQADVVYWAHTGTGRFAKTGPLRGFRVVANLYPGSLHIVTSAASGISAVADLAGKRVALDELGSGTLATAELVLSSQKIEKSDLFPLYVKHNHAGPMLARGKLDAFFFVAGYPTRSVIDVAKSTRIKIVQLREPTIRSLVSERPYFAPGVIPAGTYAGIDKDVRTVDIGTQLIVRANLDEQLVYAITAALWNDRTRKLLDKGHPKGKQVRRETALRGVGVPLHPGAARFYREIKLRK